MTIVALLTHQKLTVPLTFLVETSLTLYGQCFSIVFIHVSKNGSLIWVLGHISVFWNHYLET